MHTRKIYSIILILGTLAVMLAILPGCYFRPKAPQHLRILFTSDTQGNFTPCGCTGGPRGGMERRATVIENERRAAPGPVILLDTGNFSTGYTSSIELVKAEYVVKAMALINYDAVNVGRMDARRPREGVASYIQPGFPLTSAGYTYADSDTSERKFGYPAKVIIEREGFKIGVVGSPLDDLNPDDLGYQNEADIDIVELHEVINKAYVEDGAGLVIVITDLAAPANEALGVASRLPLASIVIAGENAQPNYTEQKSIPDIEHPIVIPRAVSWGRSLGVLDLELNRNGGIISYNLRYVDINETIPNNPILAGLASQYRAAIDAASQTDPQVRNAGYVGSSACTDCHLPEHDQWLETRHANAWSTIEETGRIQEAECIPCHVTGYGGTGAISERLIPYELRNVGCESCHGPGQVHIAYQRWKIYGELTGDIRGEDMTDPIILTPTQDMCLVCHVPPYDEGWGYATKIGRIMHD